MAELSVNNVVMGIAAVTVGLILMGSLLAPVAFDVMADLTANYGDDGKTWANLIGATVIMSVLGLVLVAINNYTKR